MSGGHFEYQQYWLNDMADEINRLIETNNSMETDEWGLEIGRHYPPDIIARFCETRDALIRTAAMVQRVDWLVSGDDGEDSFHERWAKEVPPCGCGHKGKQQ